ncbi:MAG: hypothetical protein J6Q65_05025, partial [Lentisphaeria bacterium]|nr:hypothetical protein [Lentisphaeria bacterium]
DSGVEINTARKWMGHADAQMIIRVYDSVSDNREDEQRKKVESRLIRCQNGCQDENTTPDEIDI